MTNNSCSGSGKSADGFTSAFKLMPLASPSAYYAEYGKIILPGLTREVGLQTIAARVGWSSKLKDKY